MKIKSYEIQFIYIYLCVEDHEKKLNQERTEIRNYKYIIPFRKYLCILCSTYNSSNTAHVKWFICITLWEKIYLKLAW